ncbi:MAG: 3-methyl-2-oxobutanoate dehydrogenase subunit VorB [Oscillospiraceae bacterium]|nr:3-methyl-2-oxobutanoate dehydrogenase subunit VorB [Oscillospiraceae bacterium]
MEQKLMKGNQAIAEAAIRAGCKFYAGYPITPQTELPEYLAMNLEKAGGVFIQAESEISAINMIYGAAGAGARAMTSSSSPGISLKQEGISYIVGSELPCVIVNVMRVGPGLGGIHPSQSDYFQSTKGGGHGDYRLVVLTPNSVQEMYDFTFLAFDIADTYRNPVMVLADGILGQMMESLNLSTPQPKVIDKGWATTGTDNIREHNIINSLYIKTDESEQLNLRLQSKYEKIKQTEQRYEITNPDADIMLVAFGITSRIAKQAVEEATSAGLSVGLLRPQTVWPFPSKAFEKIAKAYLTVELNSGQMIEDVKLEVNGRAPVHFLGKMGGAVLSVDEILSKIKEIAGGINNAG